EIDGGHHAIGHRAARGGGQVLEGGRRTTSRDCIPCGAQRGPGGSRPGKVDQAAGGSGGRPVSLAAAAAAPVPARDPGRRCSALSQAAAPLTPPAPPAPPPPSPARCAAGP